MNLAGLSTMLRETAGIAHKRDIAAVLHGLNLGSDCAIAVGDDCAAIPDGDGFLLFSIEGFMPGFVASDPYFAGYCAMMVNLSDIAAMGGRPVALVDALFAESTDHAAPILEGLAVAAAKYGVPIVGGHTNTRAPAAGLSAAILGRAKTLLTSFGVRPGDSILAAIDLRGVMRDPASYWDASTDAAGARLRGDLNLLPEIAESGLCRAAKDISMAGTIGTAAMLLEASELGAVIDVAKIPRPPQIPLERWLTCFPSFGFLLSTAPENAAAIISRFTTRGIAAAVIGIADASRNLRLRDGGEEQMFWRLAQDHLTGCTAREEQTHA